MQSLGFPQILATHNVNQLITDSIYKSSKMLYVKKTSAMNVREIVVNTCVLILRDFVGACFEKLLLVDFSKFYSPVV